MIAPSQSTVRSDYMSEIIGIALFRFLKRKVVDKSGQIAKIVETSYLRFLLNIKHIISSGTVGQDYPQVYRSKNLELGRESCGPAGG